LKHTFKKIVTKRNTFQKININIFLKEKHKTLFRKLLTPSYRNILRKHMLIFTNVEADLLLIKKKIERWLGNHP